jgi:hypothetical protein
MIAAVVTAERAGLDHPVDRPNHPADLDRLLATFRAQLPDRLKRSLADPASSKTLIVQCEVSGSMMRWLGTLPEKDVVTFLASEHLGV